MFIVQFELKMASGDHATDRLEIIVSDSLWIKAFFALKFLKKNSLMTMSKSTLFLQELDKETP